VFYISVCPSGTSGRTQDHGLVPADDLDPALPSGTKGKTPPRSAPLHGCSSAGLAAATQRRRTEIWTKNWDSEGIQSSLPPLLDEPKNERPLTLATMVAPYEGDTNASRPPKADVDLVFNQKKLLFARKSPQLLLFELKQAPPAPAMAGAGGVVG